MDHHSSQPQDEREAAVRAWEKTGQPSLVADDRKKMASGVAIAAMALLAMAAIWAIKHDESNVSHANTELTIAERKPVPKLKAQEAASALTASAPLAPPAPAAFDAMQSQRAQLDLQRHEQERRLLEARLKSAIMPPNSSTPAPVGAQIAELGQPADSNPGAPSSGAGERGAADANSRFARAVSGNLVAVSRVRQIEHLEYKVLQGKVIEAVSIARANSDLPGTICALVQRDVYGEQGRLPLIPWGARLCGVYSAELRKGQDRLFAIWNTLRISNSEDGTGFEVTLDSIGADQLGTAGMGGEVNPHFAQIFGTSALLSIIGAGAANAGVGASDQYNSASAYRQAVQQAAAQASQSVLAPYINMAPTVTVPAGSRVRIFVNRDLDFSAMYEKDRTTGSGHDVMFVD
jgi:type IV secretion system protein VirB10